MKQKPNHLKKTHFREKLPFNNTTHHLSKQGNNFCLDQCIGIPEESSNNKLIKIKISTSPRGIKMTKPNIHWDILVNIIKQRRKVVRPTLLVKIPTKKGKLVTQLVTPSFHLLLTITSSLKLMSVYIGNRRTHTASLKSREIKMLPEKRKKKKRKEKKKKVND